MEKEKHCPECGELIGEDERFCSNCGTELAQEVVADNPVIGSGARANIMGGINKTVTTHHNVNTSNVDNSSTVNHNTTYVMNEKKKEYCEVCTEDTTIEEYIELVNNVVNNPMLLDNNFSNFGTTKKC